jgi:polygalacturonase
MSGGVKNMHVSNCTFMGTDVGLRFKSTRGRGGVVENIYISDIRMINIPSIAISFNLYYGGKSIAETLAEGEDKPVFQLLPVTEETPQFKNISIKNVIINGAYQAVFLQGLPEMNLENVEISDMQIKAEKGFTIIDVNNVKISNVKMDIENSNVLEILNGKNVKLNDIQFNSKASNAISINGEVSNDIELISSEKTNFTKQTVIGKEVIKGAVKLN